jgi:hypothetical protein
MALNEPLRTGLALSVTVGFAYAGCSLFFWLWPQAAVVLTNALFHGLDFSKLHGAPAAYEFSGFVYALVVLMAWSFLLGALFSWIRTYFTEVTT